MSPRARVIVVPVLAACMASLLLSRSRVAGAHSGAESSRTRLEALRRDTNELERLRSQTVVAHAAQPSEGDLLSRVRRTLRDVGIADTTLRQVSRQGDLVLGGSRGENTSPYARRSERVVLEPLSLTELGRWIQTWRSSERLWTVSQIELRSTRETESSGAYAVTVDLTTTFVRPQTSTQP